MVQNSIKHGDLMGRMSKPVETCGSNFRFAELPRLTPMVEPLRDEPPTRTEKGFSTKILLGASPWGGRPPTII